MNIIKYRPITNSLLDWDLDCVLDNMFNDNAWALEGHHYPPADVKEEESRYVLTTDLPGFTDKDIVVKVENNLLTIASGKHEEKEDNNKGYLLKERRGTAFSRSFVLPKDVDTTNIEASFKDGVLSLNLAKTPAAKPRQIEIKS